MSQNHNHAPKTVYLKDYEPSDFLIDTIDCQIELAEDKATVYSKLAMTRNPQSNAINPPLVLNGETLKLISVRLDGKSLSKEQFTVTDETLIIENLPERFTLEIINENYPQQNTALSGLYRSNDMFCTQCESQGFRRITYYLDRPDVMAVFTITVVADKTKYPVLLSNGNRVDQGEMSDNRHFVKWHDPFKKPSYLFALVAGQLAKVTDTFQTQSKRQVALEIYVEPQNRDKCDAAMQALKAAMRWDEQTYGREYDLDIYMIVAVNDFNMGAMENKGLNLFNAKYILANEATATDIDFEHIEAVIGHEYFHNWTGNRVTCRDWFQLSLKEGLTVFREEQFSQDCGSAIVHRINQVKNIRTAQFNEDSGPMAHPVQPQSYIEIDNFYTSTIYSKGAEVIRMLHTLLGKERFRKGMDLYFERHDGQAVTIEDFLAALADANNLDLTQFQRWYRQAGTPVVKAMSEYDPKNKTWRLTLSQSCPPTPGQTEKEPFVIPIKIALYEKSGQKMPCRHSALLSHEQGDFLVLTKAEELFEFDNIASEPIPSLFGNFSAPVKCRYEYDHEALILLAKHDKDGFNQWDALQQLYVKVLNQLMADFRQNREMVVPNYLVDVFKHLLTHLNDDRALSAQLIQIPSFSYVAESLESVPVQALIKARKTLLNYLAEALYEPFLAVYQNHQEQTADERTLKNTCLAYLARTGRAAAFDLVEKQYRDAKNMTDMMGALSALLSQAIPLREQLYDHFYEKWSNDPLVVNKWLALNAMSSDPNIYQKLNKLITHPGFDLRNPNKVYSLVGGFCYNNPEYFHDEKGEGYRFITDRILELNDKNPQVAARMLESLTEWKRLEAPNQNLMREALVRIDNAGNLSKNVAEIVMKSL